MTDHDDRVSRRYRELPGEEPPAALDAAILSHARRATARPRARWAGVLSVAAILVLALGITLRMQHEEPGIETSPSANTAPSAPAPVESPPSTPQPAMPTPPARMEEAARPVRKRQVEAPPAKGRVAEPRPTEAREAEAVRAPSKDSASDASPPKLEVPASAPPAAAAAPSPRIAPATPTQVTPSPIAPTQLDRRAAERSRGEPDAQRDAELERIAALREAGNDREADAALAAFRERYPAYHIPDATWARVRAR